MHNPRNLNTKEGRLKRLSMHGVYFFFEEGIYRIADFYVAFDENAILRLTRCKKCTPLLGSRIKDGMIRPKISLAVAKERAIIDLLH